MKKFLIFAVLISLSFWGCSENSDVVGPADMQQQEFLKVTNGPVSELTAEAKSVLGVEEINTLNKFALPSSTSKEVSDGDAIPFLLSADGALAIGKVNVINGAENEDISVTLISEADKIALDIVADSKNSLIGTDLTLGLIGVDTEVGDTPTFFFFDENDVLVPVSVSRMIVGNGWIVVKVSLDHLSRYGFTK